MSERDQRIMEKLIAFCDRIADNLNRYDHSYEAFCSDTLFQDACCMCILQIGELAGALSEETREKYAMIPWRIIKDTRNVYVHAYGAVDLSTVWSTLREDIPALKASCLSILSEL